MKKAIDAAAAAGGGTVELGAGTYLTGSIFNKLVKANRKDAML